MSAEEKRQQQSYDPGLGAKYFRKTKRMINKDGSFNVKRIGIPWTTNNTFKVLVDMSWTNFMVCVVLAYLGINLLFACLYWLAGAENISGTNCDTPFDAFLSAFYFSAQTFTTVGYGAMAPLSTATNIIATLEAMVGLLGFALATGLLYGRFSKPSAKIIFTEKAIIAPYKDGKALMFRVVNKRKSQLMDMHANVIFTSVDVENEEFKRNYKRLNLEVSDIIFFPLSWTIVHHITEDSPMYGKSVEDLRKCQSEILIQIKGFDDTFNNEVHARHSYMATEMMEGVKFARPFSSDQEGNIVLDVDMLDAVELVKED